MSTKRTNISLLESLWMKGTQRQRQKHFSNFSDYVEDLIRKDVLEHTGTGLGTSEDPGQYGTGGGNANPPPQKS